MRLPCSPADVLREGVTRGKGNWEGRERQCAQCHPGARRLTRGDARRCNSGPEAVRRKSDRGEACTPLARRVEYLAANTWDDGSTLGPGTQRVVIPTVQGVRFGTESRHVLLRVLFSTIALIEQIGFNAHQIEQGLTTRGDGQRPQARRCRGHSRRRVEPTRAATEAESRWNASSIRWCRCWEIWGCSSACAERPTPATSAVAGTRTQTRRVKITRQKERATEEHDVCGFHALVLIDVPTRLPLTMNAVPIQEDKERWFVPLFEQARHQPGRRGPIESIVIDRGSLDGAGFWQRHQQRVLMVVASKADMTVTTDAQSLAKKEGTSPWHVGRFPRPTQAAVIVHAHVTVLVMALCITIRLWQVRPSDQESETLANVSSTLLDGEGTARWRERLTEEHRDTLM